MAFKHWRAERKEKKVEGRKKALLLNMLAVLGKMCLIGNWPLDSQ